MEEENLIDTFVRSNLLLFMSLTNIFLSGYNITCSYHNDESLTVG